MIAANHHAALRRPEQITIELQDTALKQNRALVRVGRKRCRSKRRCPDPANTLRAVVHGGDEIANGKVVDQHVLKRRADRRAGGEANDASVPDVKLSPDAP